jgi:hypothetical protein
MCRYSALAERGVMAPYLEIGVAGRADGDSTRTAHSSQEETSAPGGHGDAVVNGGPSRNHMRMDRIPVGTSRP